MSEPPLDTATLVELIDAFTAEHRDHSLAAVNRIEIELDRLFGDDDRFGPYITDLASYRPFGGEHLIAEEEIVPTMRRLLATVRL